MSSSTGGGNQEDPGDLTRKERREQARTARKALEQAEVAGAARRRRLAQLGGVIAIVVVVIVAIVIATGSNSKPPKPGSGGSAETQTVAEVKSLLAGIPQSANVLGDPKAPVSMQYFGDLECPICKEFTLDVLPSIVTDYVRTGKLKIEYHSLETATREPETFKLQQVAALAAGKQNLMWYFVELFYHEQGEEDSGYVTESYIQGLAKQVPGLSLTAWSAARSDPTLAAKLTGDAQTANQEGFTGTPSFLLGKSSGTLSVFSPPSFTEPSSYLSAIAKLAG